MLLATVIGVTTQKRREMSEKIQAIHMIGGLRLCTAVFMQQVRTRLEGQRRQYDLRERAQTLGFQRVTVIDEDLGRSGTGCSRTSGLRQIA